MLNKPRFMSPSINMQDCTVVDVNSDTLPFSCIIDGGESVVGWQVKIYRLSDNSLVLDTGKQNLDKPFYPIDNRNRNVVFKLNLKEYFAKSTTCYFPAASTYDSSKTYYTRETDPNNETLYIYSPYSYNSSTWSTDYETLYYIEFANSKDPYYWNISFWGSSGTAVSGTEEVFYANSSPEVSVYYSYDNIFSNEDNEYISDLLFDETKSFDKRRIFFKADYSQHENIPIKRYGWRLTDLNSSKVIFDNITKKQIYGINDNISCECSGLINQNSYLIELYIETQNGYFGIVKALQFSIDYDVKTLDVDFEISPLNMTSGIMLNWGNLKTVEGVVVGTPIAYSTNYPISSYDSYGNPNGSVSAEIPDGSQIIFEENANGKSVEIDEDSYVVLSFQFDKDKDTTLFEMSGFDSYSNAISRELHYIHDTHKLEYSVTKGFDVVSDSAILSDTSGERTWNIVTMAPMIKNSDGTLYTNIKVVESTATNSLLPSDDLYPSEEEYPYLGEWDKLRGVT